MAHTTFTLRVEGVQNTSSIESQLRSIADERGLQFDVSVVSPRFKVTVLTDHDPMDPRRYNDDACVMFCKHGRYSLGDEGAADPFEEAEGAEVDGHWMSVEDIDYAIDMLSEYDGFPDDPSDAVKDLVSARDDYEVKKVLRDDVAIILPLYLYDHSGITISHGPFSCPWDSGQVGWHYITKDVLEYEWGGDEEKARACLEAELETYDAFLRGDVWGYSIEDEEGDVVDSCCGFYGDAPEHMKQCVEYRFHKALEEAWEHRHSERPVICDSEGNIIDSEDE